jgi:hypothetical protein
VSIIALIVALTGTAVAAGPTAYQAIKGKTIIKKIGKGKLPGSKLKNDSVTNKQVKESTLATVPSATHATTADTAGTAGTAGSASTAASAATAGTVAGFAPSGLTRVASASDDNNAHVFLTSGVATILSTSITAPSAGFLFITAGSDVYNGADDSIASCWIEVDGTEFDPSERTIDVDSAYNREEDCTTEATIPVGAGSRTVVFRADSDPLTWDEATLNVLFVPFDGNGNPPAAAKIASARQSAGRHGNR